MELAFDHLFDVNLDDDEAQRITHRFKRARSQILPIFSSMVVSPFERERHVALTLLSRIGGQATAKMLETILADDEVHDAFKLDVRRLKDRLQPDALDDDDDDDDDDELADRDEAAETADGDDEPAGQAADASPKAESEDGQPAPPRRRRAGRGRGRGRRSDKPAAEPSATIDPKIFDGDPQQLLPHLEGPIESVMQTFGDVPLPKRLSFVDRSSRLEDPRILTFLLPLLQTDEWALVQSALRAIGQLGFPEAMADVEKLASESSRKRVKLRAERVRDMLQQSDKQPAPKPVAKDEPVAASQPESLPEREKPQPQPQPKRRGRGRDAAPEPAAAAHEFGLLTPQPPDPRPAPEPALEAPAKLPKLGTCLASGIGLDGSQRLQVYRQSAGDDKALDVLDLRIHGTGGWLDLAVVEALDSHAPKMEQERAGDRGEDLVEVTVGYLRGRLIEACDQSKGVGRELPSQSDAALAYVGSGRKQDLAAELPDQPADLDQDKIEALLNVPLFAGWRLPLAADGGAVQRWEQTTGKRSASRVRRRLIDDVAKVWYQSGVAPTLVALLQRQAVLLQRAGHEELAQTALACAASLHGEPRHPERDLLLRELVYRGFQAGLDESEARRDRTERAEFLGGRRDTLSRSAFQRGLRRRGR